MSVEAGGVDFGFSAGLAGVLSVFGVAAGFVFAVGGDVLVLFGVGAGCALTGKGVVLPAGVAVVFTFVLTLTLALEFTGTGI